MQNFKEENTSGKTAQCMEKGRERWWILNFPQNELFQKDKTHLLNYPRILTCLQDPA